MNRIQSTDLWARLLVVDKNASNERDNRRKKRLLAERSSILQKLRGINKEAYMIYFDSLKKITGDEGDFLRMLMPQREQEKLNTRTIYKYEDIMMEFRGKADRCASMDTIEKRLLSLIYKGYLMISSDESMVCLMPNGIRYLTTKYGKGKIRS